ncbi:MAG: division/cell wall cluster transcriptional repressor MraZ [Candidatus Omnitrophica bacterium]|nr:division/cell wall cluster transcriptional repressor MraZ [Candidatus Omnitrophota bacterium]
MFYGEYKHNLDNKGRLILPSKFRETCKDCGLERFFLTRGLDKCIFMFSEDEWRVQENKFRNMPFTKKESRSFNRMFFSGAVDITPDKQGRFIIPPYLKDYALIKRETVLIGVANRIEIWDRKSWEDFYENSNASFEEIAENMLDL